MHNYKRLILIVLILGCSTEPEPKYGCIDQKQQSLFLYQPLVIIEQDTFVCTSNNASFNASVVGDPIHSWNLNDGNILGPDTAISHNYSQSGFYEVIL